MILNGVHLIIFNEFHVFYNWLHFCIIFKYPAFVSFFYILSMADYISQ